MLISGPPYLDRNVDLDPQARLISAWTVFTFPGRRHVSRSGDDLGLHYNQMQWDKSCFTGVDVNAAANQQGSIWRFTDKRWAHDVDNQKGNDDYL